MIARAGITLLMMMAAAAADRPLAALIQPAGSLAVTLPADLLRDDEVRQQLTSGLTTVFVVSTTARDDQGTSKGGSRIEVRYALWEEQYLVTVLGPTGEQSHFTFSSSEAFGQWWSGTPLTVAAPRRYGPRVTVQVRLTVLPFSASDQRDTRRWLARILSTDGGTERDGSRSAEILRIIVETSVRRRPLLEREWSVAARREEPR